MKEINSQELSTLEKNFILDVYSDTCVPCQALLRTLSSLESEYTQVDFYKLNGHQNRDWCVANNIRNVPTLQFYKNNVIVHQVTGNQTQEKLKELIDKYYR